MTETELKQISRNTFQHNLFADGQIIMANSEDQLNISIHKLKELIGKYRKTISIKT
jgi:hypothetical protein